MRISIETPLSTPIDSRLAFAIVGDAAVFWRRFGKMEFLPKLSNNWYKPVSFKSDFLPFQIFARSKIKGEKKEKKRKKEKKEKSWKISQPME